MKNMPTNDYTRAMKYEMLIRNAYSCQRGSQNGADLNFMKNAIALERKDEKEWKIMSFEKVKAYISNALLHLDKTKPYSKEAGYFNSLQSILKDSSSTKQLTDVVNNALEKVIELKIHNY